MLKTVPQKDKDGKYASEKKDKRSKKKSKKQSTDVSKNIDVKYRDNEKSRANSRNNSQAGNRDIKAPECSLTLAKSETAWDPAGNAAVSLFPNVDSIVMSEEEMIERAIKESMETAFLEKCAMDITHNEAAEKSAAQPEIEAEWGQVQRNLPTPEPEKVSEVSDRNNNSGLHPIENLTVPGDKLQRRRWNKGQEKEDKNCGRRSETQSRNEVPMAIETPLVPTVVPKFVDKYGRIDGCNEKRLFMGKGARFKEQEYIRQLQLQEQQLTDPNLFTETQVSSSNSSTKSSNPPNALTQVSAQSKQTGDTNSRASFQKSNETPTDLLDQACGYSHDHTENTQEFNSKLENNSQYSRRSVDQFLSKMEEISNTSQYPAESAIVSADLSSEQFALPKQEFTTVSSEELPDRSQNSMQPLMENLNKLEIDGNSFKNNYDPPTMQSWTGSQELVDSSEAFSSQKLKQSTDLPKETRDSEINQISYNSEETSRQIKKEQTPIQSHLDSGSQTKTIVNISDETSGRMKQNSYISEQIPTESNQNFAPPGRPIVSGANYNNYQQKRHQSSGISVNRGGYHNGNSGDRNYNKNVRESQGEYDRGSRSEQNSSRTYGRGYNSSGYGGPKGDRNFYGPRGEPKRDFYKNARYEQNPHKYVQHNNVYQKDQRDNYQSSQKSSGGPNRDFQKGPRIDKTSHKFDDENREFNGESRGDRNFYKPDGEQKRDTNKSQTVDTNSFKSAGESIKKENNNEYLAHSQIDKKPPVSRQDLNINAPVFQIGPHSWSADVPDSQETFENAVQDVKSDTKDFNEISSNISEIPDISNFASRFSVPPPVHDFTKEMISVPPVVPPPTNHFSVTQVPHYPEINDAACSKENLPQPSSNFQAPPGFPCLERPAIPSCVCYTSGMSFEAKYASLLLKDPLLFRLLQQKQAESFNGSLKNPGIPETSGDRKVYGSCPNCSCNSQSPRNFNETTNVNVKTCQTEEERAKFELWQRMNSQPVNALNLRYPIAVQHPEALQMSHVENTEWNAGNMRNSNIPLHENPQLLPCYVDPAGNTFPLNYPLPQSYQHVQRPINLPRGEECQGFFVPGFENLPLDVQRLMHQRMMAQLYENPSGYSVIGAHYNEQIQPTMARHNQQISQIPVPFPPHKYEADIAAINRSNVVQDRLDDYHQAEYHQPPRSPGVEYNNQKANEETVQVFPSDIGVGRMKTLLSIPNKGRGRARLPQNN